MASCEQPTVRKSKQTPIDDKRRDYWLGNPTTDTDRFVCEPLVLNDKVDEKRARRLQEEQEAKGKQKDRRSSVAAQLRALAGIVVDVGQHRLRCVVVVCRLVSFEFAHSDTAHPQKVEDFDLSFEKLFFNNIESSFDRSFDRSFTRAVVSFSSSSHSLQTGVFGRRRPAAAQNVLWFERKRVHGLLSNKRRR